MCNDADAAVLAEQWVGTAKGGVKDFIMLSMARLHALIDDGGG